MMQSLSSCWYKLGRGRDLEKRIVLRMKRTPKHRTLDLIFELHEVDRRQSDEEEEVNNAAYSPVSSNSQPVTNQPTCAPWLPRLGVFCVGWLGALQGDGGNGRRLGQHYWYWWRLIWVGKQRLLVSFVLAGFKACGKQ